jgi:hypothetical protein
MRRLALHGSSVRVVGEMADATPCVGALCPFEAGGSGMM